MSTQNNGADPGNNNPEDGNPEGGKPQQNTGADEAAIQARIAEAVADIKGKLDKAYEQRDAAVSNARTLEQKIREAEVAALTAQGKKAEALELQLQDLRSELEQERTTNVSLSRDINVRSELASLRFRNEKAAAMAFSEITAELVRDAKGVWVHRSGISVKDFVKVYSENADHGFLFEPKVSTGSGSSSSRSTTVTKEKGSLFQMSQDEVLNMAREGKLPARRK